MSADLATKRAQQRAATRRFRAARRAEGQVEVRIWTTKDKRAALVRLAELPAHILDELVWRRSSDDDA